jgi:chromosome segregation ATPase
MGGRLLTLGVISFTWVLLCSAQSNSSSGQQDSSKAQCAPGVETKSQAQLADTTKKKPKKVWTNDEIEGAKSDTSITNKNVAGAGGASSSSPSAAAKSATYENLVKTYQKKLAPLRDQLAEIDRKVQQVKDLKGNARENTEQLLSYYGEKRAGVQLKIDRVEEDARRDGVAPGDLR